MDVLELPRPVINFLRTMAKESCRYALSWDIFGGPDSVTLTLTWKLLDDESSSTPINETSTSKQQQSFEDPHTPPRMRALVKSPNLSSSSRRSRRDEAAYCNSHINENVTVPAIFRSSRGKSLEGSSTIVSNRPATTCHHQQHTKDHQHVSSLERPSTAANHYHRRRKDQSDQAYGTVYETRSPSVVKCATISSLSSSSSSPQPSAGTSNHLPVMSVAHGQHRRTKPQPVSSSAAAAAAAVNTSSLRKVTRPLATSPRTPATTSVSSSNYTKLRRSKNLATYDDDDDDDVLDPWVKRFECSLEDNDNETTEQSDEKEPTGASTTTGIDESGLTSGKVKFKTKPDYI